MMRRRAFLLSVPTVAATSVPGVARQGRITLGTAAGSGGFPIYGEAFVTMMKAVDPILDFRLVATRGAADNVAMLEDGDLDLALVSGEVAQEVLSGVGQARSNLKVVTAGYAMPGMFAVRADSRFRTIAGLKGHRVIWNERDSGLARQARYVMGGLGLDLDRDFEAIYPGSLAEGSAMVIDGRASALWGAGLRWPGFVKAALSVRGARFIAPDADEIATIRKKYPFLVPLTVPAGLYRGQYQAIETVGTWSMMLARADLQDELGRRLAASLQKAERTGQLTKHLLQTTARNTLAVVPARYTLQPGVMRYYREAGLLR
jgi:TRAP transporter TAXI family solute receptor